MTKQNQIDHPKSQPFRTAKWLLNVVGSFLYDFRYSLTDRIRLRAGSDSYIRHRAHRLYPDYLKFGAAMEAVRPLAAKYCYGRGVDVGAGHWPLSGARPVEDGVDENAYALKEADESLDFVFSSHTLEHLDRPWDALNEWVRTLKPGGVLFLYLPHPACEMWKPEQLQFHRWSPDPVTLEEKLSVQFALHLLYVSYLPDAFFSFVVIARKGGAE
jgi:SAM-dependent methyltransferase